MVRVEKDKFIIEIEHPFPEEGVYELKRAIIAAIQTRELNDLTDFLEFQDTNFVLLELLKNIDIK
jgi:hypothetical protein